MSKFAFRPTAETLPTRDLLAAPAFTPPAVQSVEEGDTLTYQLSAYDPAGGPVTYLTCA